MTVYACPDCIFHTVEIDAAIVHEQQTRHRPADEVKNAPEPVFAVGDHVRAVAVPGGFPTPRPEVPGLTVTTVRLMVTRETGPQALAPYWRVTAHAADRIQYVEGAERFFAPEEHSEQPPPVEGADYDHKPGKMQAKLPWRKA